MRVLVANKFWYRRGGLERVMFDEIAWLEAAGHEVSHFSTSHPSNEVSPWSPYFVPYLELGVGGGLTISAKAKAASRMFHNREAARRFSALLAEFRPDVVHAHGIHRQLSPSILVAASRIGVPVVQTLHDFHHLCPADVMLRGDGSVCRPRQCGRVWYGAAVVNRCVRESLSSSALSAVETSFQRFRRAYERTVTRFISPSGFLAQAMHDGGWTVPCDVIPNALQIDAEPRPVGTYVLCATRLSAEKGVEVLLRAGRAAGLQVVVAGEGPLDHHLRTEHPEARFVGRVSGSEVQRLIRGARVCVVPSTCFENSPMSVLEPMAAGVPVVASDVGGIPELVEDEVHGLLVPPGNVDALASALVRLTSDPALAARLGSAARARVSELHSPERHLESLLTTYRAALST